MLAVLLEGHIQPLHAFYAQSCLPIANQLLDEGSVSPRDLFQRCDVRTVDAADLLELDPRLLSFRDLDTREEYEAALHEAETLRKRRASP